MGRRWRLGWLAVLLLSGCADGGPGSCRIERVADLKLLPDARPMVVARLGGTPVAMLIDTGGQTSAVSQAAVDRFALQPTDRTMLIGGVGNMERAPVVVLRNLELGGGHARELELPVLQNLPGTVHGLPFLGIFGADFLSNYDVDVDLPGGRFAMYALGNCDGRIAPLDPPVFELPFENESTAIGIEIRLDGVPLHAVLDTGSSVTLVTDGDARRAGVGRPELQRDPFHRDGGDAHNQLDLWLHRFGRLEVGDESMNNFRFTVGDPMMERTLLGADFLRFNHVWISYPHRMLFIQPNLGNPIVQQVGAPAGGGVGK